MNCYEEDLQYERKMDRISEEIEEMILDAMIAALQKIRERNLHFAKIANRPQPDPFPF
jgi:hypothetical protein